MAARTIDLTTQEFKKIPGYSTKLSVNTLQGMVAGLMRKHGVKDYAWGSEGGQEFLVFSLEVEVQGIEKKIGFQFKPPLIRVKKRKGSRYGPWDYVDKPEASWRIFHDLLERSLAAAQLGITPVHHVLMSFISKRLPDGSMGTFGDFLDLVHAYDKLEDLALPAPAPERKTIEVEVEKRE